MMFVFHEYEILPGVNKEALYKAIQAANTDFNPGKIKEDDGTLIVSVPIVNTRIKDTLTSIEVANYLLNTLIDSVLQEYKKQDSLYSLAETSVTKLLS